MSENISYNPEMEKYYLPINSFLNEKILTDGENKFRDFEKQFKGEFPQNMINRYKEVIYGISPEISDQYPHKDEKFNKWFLDNGFITKVNHYKEKPDITTVHILNLDTAKNIIKNNVDLFPPEASENPKKWLTDWFEFKKNEQVKIADNDEQENERLTNLDIMHGLLSGFPRESTLKYPKYNQLRIKMIREIEDDDPNKHIIDDFLFKDPYINSKNNNPDKEKAYKILLEKYSKEDVDLVASARGDQHFLAFSKEDYDWFNKHRKIVFPEE